MGPRSPRCCLPSKAGKDGSWPRPENRVRRGLLRASARWTWGVLTSIDSWLVAPL